MKLSEIEEVGYLLTAYDEEDVYDDGDINYDVFKFHRDNYTQNDLNKCGLTQWDFCDCQALYTADQMQEFAKAQVKLLKLQQQALPVVPEWLDIEIKNLKSTSKHPTVDVLFGVADAIVAVKNGNIHSKLYDYLFCGKQDVCNQHQDVFALAFITRKYQVEKPQLFYLKNKLTTSYLALDTNTGYYEHWGEEIIPKLLNKQGYKISFTQSEIGSMETGSYEQIEVME